MLKNLVKMLTTKVRQRNFEKLYNALYGYFYTKNQLSSVVLLSADLQTRDAIFQARKNGVINWLYESRVS